MTPYLEDWNAALLDSSSDAAVRVLADAVHGTIAQWTVVNARVYDQPEGALRDQRLARLDAIHARLLYYAGLMDVLGALYVPPGRPLYTMAIYEPTAELPAWMDLQGTVADGFAQSRYSVAQWLDEAVARPLLEGDYTEMWSLAVQEVSTMDDDDGEPIVNYSMPPPGIMGVDEWDQIEAAQSATTALPLAEGDEEEVPEIYRYKATTLAQQSEGIPMWVMIAAVGVTGLFIGAVLARRGGD